MGWRNLRILKNYAVKVLEKDSKRLVYKDWVEIGKDIKTQYPLIRPKIAKRIIMSNLELANKTILDLLLKNDIKPERGLNVLKEAETIARTNQSSGDLIKIADRYLDLHDLKPAKVKVTESRTSNNIDYETLTKVKQTISTTKKLDNNQKENSNKD